MAPQTASSHLAHGTLCFHTAKAGRSLGVWSSVLCSALLLSASNTDAANYHLGTSGNNLQWNRTQTLWKIDGADPLVAWDWSQSQHRAIFDTTGASTLYLDESLTLSGLTQSGTASTQIGALGSGVTLTLQGLSEFLHNSSNSELRFLEDLSLHLSPASSTELMSVNAASGDIRIDGQVSGALGSLVSSQAVGGLEKTGEAALILNGSNTYSGFTRLKGGVVEAGSASAFGTSKILFEGGTLRYGTGVTTDFSSQFHATPGVGGIKIDTNGNHVTFATGLSGANQGFTKLGNGTLSLASNNVLTGPIEVKGGILKGATAGFNSFSSVNGATIRVHNGATLDVNATATSGHNWGTVQYNITIEGKGVADATKVGGYAGAITNSGALTLTRIFSNITLSGDATISGTRWDIGNIDARGFTITKTGGDIAWGNGTKSNVKDIRIEEGRLYADASDFGDSNSTIYINASYLPNTTSVAHGVFQNYGTTVINKQIRLNGGEIGATGGNNTNGSFTFDTNSTITLQANSLRENSFAIYQHNKDLILKGKLTGNAGFTTALTNTTLSGNTARYAVLSILNSANDFTGTIKISRGIMRLSDGTLNGSLGNAANTVQFTAGASSGAVGSSTDNNAILDLFGTSQNIGALNGTQVSHQVINNRAGSTATLSLGNGNANGNFAGTLRDSYTLPNTAITGEGTTGILNFTKKGTGAQILSGANLYSGVTRVEAGTLLANNASGSATGTSAVLTVAGSGARLGGTGSLSGGNSKDITLGAGTFLMVGNSHQAQSYHTSAGIDSAAKTLTLGSAQNVDITLSGAIQVDLFSKTSSDLLRLISQGGDLTMNGLIEVGLASNANTSNWAIGDTWKILDWNSVTGPGAFSQNLQLKTSTLAGFSLSTYVDGRAMYLQLAAIPEPSRAALLLGGLFGGFIRRRNR